MRTIRVMVVEDSPTVRELLCHIIGSDPRLAVVGQAESAEAALERLESLQPDVVTMDIRLPGMNGFEATSLIMARRPTPVVVVSANVDSEELNITMNALRAGALAVVEKPMGVRHEDYEGLAKRLCQQLVIMSQVRVVRQRIKRPVEFPRSAPAPMPEPRTSTIKVVGLAASTGGPAALVRLLGGLPADFPVPILLVQHITPAFLAGFVRWLGGSVPQRVVEARNGVTPAAGTIYVAPAHGHLESGARFLRVTDADPVHSQRPSASVLFSSLARWRGPEAAGVLLTGMGQDGADGLLELRKAGGHTLVEDESTAVVFGMPGAAMALGAAVEALPLTSIAGRLRELVE